jgi:hypothetical protein
VDLTPAFRWDGELMMRRGQSRSQENILNHITFRYTSYFKYLSRNSLTGLANWTPKNSRKLHRFIDFQPCR